MVSVREAFDIAVQRFQANQWQDAEQFLRQILQADSNHFDALTLLGVIGCQTGRAQLGIDCLTAAARLKPNLASAHSNLGNALVQQGKLEDAVRCYRQALSIDPEFADANCNLGNALRELGRPAEAVASLQQALRLRSNSAEVYGNLGVALKDLGKLDEAIACFRNALAVKPNFADVHNNLGITFKDQGKFEEAIDSCRRALEIRPDYAEAHSNLGSLFIEQGKLDEAIDCCRRALEIKPKYAEAHINLGNALMSLGKLDEAIACYQRSIDINAHYTKGYCNLGVALMDQGDLDRAIDCCRRALEIDPDYDDAHTNLGVMFLKNGEFINGWSEYEFRLKTFKRPELALPKWDGSPLSGRKILLMCEQGLGDTLQFIRYAALVKERGGHVIVVCQPPLRDLLSGCAEIDELVVQPTDPMQPLPAADVYSYLMSLPRVLGTTLETIPNRVPYIQADPQLIENWRRELERFTELKIGISWQGNPKFKRDRFRSPSLAEFETLNQIPGIRFFSLQKGIGKEQVRLLAERLPITDFTDRMDESTGPFLDTAALITNLDLVITSDTSIAHLAGALGAPVWVVLDFAADWRWLTDRDDCPWYPNMRLFRQEVSGDWKGVFQRIAVELRQLTASKNKGRTAAQTGSVADRRTTSEVSVTIETSIGELVDKITILEIKSDRITDSAKLVNVRCELEALQPKLQTVVETLLEVQFSRDQFRSLVSQLKSVNEALWQIEDDIRDCERLGDFGQTFVELARSVYRQNDRRAALKRQINMLAGSRIVEEKSYQNYEQA